MNPGDRHLPSTTKGTSSPGADRPASYDMTSLLAQGDDHAVEAAATDFLVTHRVIARAGLGFTLPSVDAGLFELLAQLEHHCSTGRAHPRVVWQMLTRIGKRTADLLSEDAALAIRHASAITVFSNFPLGLAILPGNTAPLTCQLPIAYRPLLPLTRAIQFELFQPPIFYLGAGFHVLIAECIDRDDPAGALSREGWSYLRTALTEVPHVECKYAEIRTAEDLQNALSNYRVDILILSAHGHFNAARNVSGIIIGDEFCLGPELGPLPPLVILSACQVSPRGSGVVSIADLLVREGAVAVLGTLIPIRVIHNATMMVRLFVYITEAMAGREPERSLAEIWHRVATSNMVNDILDANRASREWKVSRFGDLSVIEEFMLHRSVGRIHLQNVYRDAEAVLEDMARECGMQEKFRAWIKSPGYLPESLFYEIIGWPERIVVQDACIAKIMAKGS